nr:hypothetical protein [Allopusillimonas ginsengisoli]
MSNPVKHCKEPHQHHARPSRQGNTAYYKKAKNKQGCQDHWFNRRKADPHDTQQGAYQQPAKKAQWRPYRFSNTSVSEGSPQPDGKHCKKMVKTCQRMYDTHAEHVVG